MIDSGSGGSGGMGVQVDAVGVTNQPHQSPSRPCITERNDVFGTVGDLIK